ncbi:hypothetical protein FRB98_003755 [Tulasnella sp. 332]|nr:hypothetical protein FRB98_003755 [Tulasnella sp. 332]
MFPFDPRQPRYYSNYYPHPQTPGAPSYDPFNPFSSQRRSASTFDALLEPEYDESMMDPNSYRRLALEHQRRAEVAIALAQEQEQRNRELQRQLALDRLRTELGYAPIPNAHGRRDSSPQERSRLLPQHHRESAENMEQRSSPTLPAYFPIPVETLRHGHGTLEDEIRAFLQRREQEREHVMKIGAHSPSNEPSRPSQPSGNSRSQPTAAASTSLRGTVQHQVQNEQKRVPVQAEADFATRLRTALSSGRSEEEKDKILQELGIMNLQNIAHTAPEKKEGDAPRSSIQPEQAATTPKPATAPTPSTPVVPNTHKISTQSLAAIDTIQTQFDALKADFTFPAVIEFDPSSDATTTSNPPPKLLYNQMNAPVLHHESELIKLLTKLDAIESGGAESVRGARKALVLAIEEELSKLDSMKHEAWNKSKVGEISASESGDVEEEEETETSAAVEDELVGDSSVAAVEAEDQAVVANGPVEDTSNVDPNPMTEAPESEELQPATDPRVGTLVRSSTSDGPPPSAPEQESVADLSSSISSMGIASRLDDHREASTSTSDKAMAQDSAPHPRFTDSDATTPVHEEGGL